LETKEAARRIPSATYRLQFNREFSFHDAAAITDYLHELGITDCYASPLFRARPQSTHGYDVCAFDQFSPELGGAGEFESFSERLQQLGMGLVLDIVPNHMSANPGNSWWLDVLQNGLSSAYSSWFDIDWESSAAGPEKVLVPILEAHYAKVLESGKLRLAFEEGKLLLRYHDFRLPLSAESRAAILNAMAAQVRQQKKDSADLSVTVPRFLAQLNGKIGEPRSFDALDQLLRQQHYRLAFWGVASDEINYRRFFDIAELVSLRMELPEVFKATHRFLLSLLKSGCVNGLRIDHPDGLWNPKQYFERLNDACRSALGRRFAGRQYVVAEKILSGDEALHADWQVDGTTGYDFLNCANGLFVDSANVAGFDEIYAEFIGNRADFKGLVLASKLKVLETLFRSELKALTHRLLALARRTRQGQDFTFRGLRSALAQVIAAFPVYRTYVTEDTTYLSATDREFVLEALRNTRNPALEFIQSLLSLNTPAELDEGGQKLAREFVMRFQQLTAPVMAKGLEDTAFYNFNRLISLNEVGGSPDKFGVSVDAFHHYNARKSENWPHAMLATATHDTKRGEDARTRVNVLSEMPAEWGRVVSHWSTLNSGAKRLIDGALAPCPNDEYLLYQTLIGALPHELKSETELREFRDRVVSYFRKALREAKTNTSWSEPNAAYEEAALGFAEQLLSLKGPFFAEFKCFHQIIDFFGKLNSLSQVLLKLTCPGLPDLYQGTELWDFNMVDPDNRRPVDYDLRRRLLDLLKERWRDDFKQPDSRAFFSWLFNHRHSQGAKLFLIWRTLNFRRAHEELFRDGEYIPLSISGTKCQHVCAFARQLHGEAIVVVVPRLLFSLTNGVENFPFGREMWKDTAVEIPHLIRGKEYRDVLTGGSVKPAGNGRHSAIAMSDMLKLFPVALLTREHSHQKRRS
jgi:(1->4)-alpha-D-glucan 1-alpha-D-glucosylmutase